MPSFIFKSHFFKVFNVEALYFKVASSHLNSTILSFDSGLGWATETTPILFCTEQGHGSRMASNVSPSKMSFKVTLKEITSLKQVRHARAATVMMHCVKVLFKNPVRPPFVH